MNASSITVLLIIISFFLSCESDDSELKIWFDQNKESILEDAKLNADRVDSSEKNDRYIYKVHYFNKGKEFKQEWINAKGKKELEILFSKDKLWELRHEFCESGSITFEGLFLNKQPIGPSYWWHCDGTMSEVGIRYNNGFVGKWQKFDTEGNVVSVIDHDNLQTIDYIKGLKNYR